MPSLLIPYATAPDGRYVTPNDAARDDEHRCPQCGDLVVLRRGEVKRAHFAHKPSATCSAETVEHIVAKHAVAEAARSDRPIVVRLQCAQCRGPTWVDLPRTFNTVCIEQRLTGGRVADVALLRTLPRFQDVQTVALAVEVRKTHAVDEAKAVDLQGVAWVEIHAAEAIADPFTWRAVQHNLNALCQPCVQRRDTIAAIAARDDVVWDEATTTPALINCWKCGAEILAFTWQGVRPGNPMPWVVSYRWVQTTKSLQWVTFCPHCGQTQGDFYRGRDIAAWYNAKINEVGGEAGALLQPWGRA